MAVIIIVLAVTGALGVAGLALLVIVIVGIRASERRTNLNRTAEISTEKLASRKIGASEVRTR